VLAGRLASSPTRMWHWLRQCFRPWACEQHTLWPAAFAARIDLTGRCHVAANGAIRQHQSPTSWRLWAVEFRVDIFGRCRAGVDEQPPRCPLGHWRKNELTAVRRAIRQQHDVASVGVSRWGAEQGDERWVAFTPIDRRAQCAVPTNVRQLALAFRFPGHEFLSTDSRLFSPKMDQRFCKSQHVGVFFNEVPVEPGDFVVLTIGVVITILCAANFITRNQHRHTLTEDQCGQHVANLSRTKFIDDRSTCDSLDAVVFAQVVVLSISIPFAIFLVVLLSVGDHVVESEPVVRRDKIDTTVGWTAGALIQVTRA